MRFTYTAILILLHGLAVSQLTKTEILYRITFNKEPIQLGTKYFLESLNDSVSFETIKFYVSDIELYKNEELVAVPEKKYFLIDVSNEESKYISLTSKNNEPFNKLKFNIGIDSLTNVSGVIGGDLDPTNGMYWTWQSGYINFKIEGKTKSCPARNNLFQFHIGGYQNPYNAMQKVELKTSGKNKIVIEVAIDELLNKINLKETNEVMSPNTKAVEIAQSFSSVFTLAK
jgi:hypothetical protein